MPAHRGPAHITIDGFDISGMVDNVSIETRRSSRLFDFDHDDLSMRDRATVRVTIDLTGDIAVEWAARAGSYEAQRQLAEPPKRLLPAKSPGSPDGQ